MVRSCSRRPAGASATLRSTCGASGRGCRPPSTPARPSPSGAATRSRRSIPAMTEQELRAAVLRGLNGEGTEAEYLAARAEAAEHFGDAWLAVVDLEWVKSTA